MEWEYQRLRFRMGWRVVAGKLEEGVACGDEVLNQYGRQGWEVISIVPESEGTNAGFIAIMKRPLRPN